VSLAHAKTDVVDGEIQYLGICDACEGSPDYPALPECFHVHDKAATMPAGKHECIVVRAHRMFYMHVALGAAPFRKTARYLILARTTSVTCGLSFPILVAVLMSQILQDTYEKTPDRSADRAIAAYCAASAGAARERRDRLRLRQAPDVRGTTIGLKCVIGAKSGRSSRIGYMRGLVLRIAEHLTSTDFSLRRFLQAPRLPLRRDGTAKVRQIYTKSTTSRAGHHHLFAARGLR